MFRLAIVGTLLATAVPCLAGGLDAFGNTDGVLTWDLGRLEPGGTATEAVLLVYGPSYDGLLERLEAVRKRFGGTPDRPDAELRGSSAPPVWIANEATDFALEGPGLFRWRMERQALRAAEGGQLSQFTWYVHYRDADGERRAGTPHVGESTPENLAVVEPVAAVGPTELRVVVETADRKLRIAIRAAVGPGSAVGIHYAIANRSTEPIDGLRLATYANIEAAHTHESDYSCLDRRVDGLLVVDPGTGTCVAMAGTRAPVSGHAGTWNSLEHVASASGVARGEWSTFAALPDELEKKLARLRARAAAPANIYLPHVHDDPTTPETRTLTPDEAAAARRRDWLFQAMGEPLGQRALKEIGWARALADRLAQGSGAPALRSEREALDRLEDRLLRLAGRRLDDAAAEELYLAVRAVKRRIAFKNPALDFSQLVFIDQPYPQGPVNDIHEAIHRMGITATPGGRLLVLDGLDPGGAVRKLAPDEPGSFWRPDLSFDARRVLFCYKAHDERSFHLYEIGLDGTGLSQLTHGDYDDLDPLYLPDGGIAFTTTRGNSYVRCGPFIYSTILARCDADGGNLYLLSHGGEPDFVPSLMSDGRLIYSRWEYTDKPLWRVQSLWTTNPDGTGTAVFWGNQSVWPDHLSEPRQIPGSRRVMFSGVGHHDWWSGSIGIVDPARGFNFPHGLTKVTCDLRWPECSLPPLDPPESARYHPSGNYTGYKTPYPLSEDEFLVSARGEAARFRLYWMDVDGNRELIYEGRHNVLHAIPVRPRPVPTPPPDLVAWPATGGRRGPAFSGAFYSADVYQGVPDLPRGSARYLRVFQMDHKTYSTWGKTWRHSGPAVSVVQEEGVKRIVSVVPVEDDGSVHFEAPPGRAFHFQLLDERFRCLQTMRSFVGLMPGERRGCVGCHEMHSTAPPSRHGLALPSPTGLPVPWAGSTRCRPRRLPSTSAAQ